MKLLFFGDVMFGRDNNEFLSNPFINVQKFFQDFNYLIFNLETNIHYIKELPNNKKENKVFNYQANGLPLITLKKIFKGKIICSIANNHSLDYGVTGYFNTKKFLLENNIYFSDKYEPIIMPHCIFFNATDHCGCNDLKKWSKYIWVLDYKNKRNNNFIKKKVEYYKKKYPRKKIIFSCHWGPNYVDKISSEIKEFGRFLIDIGVSIVFGHSAHHIPPEIYDKYKKGIIIYGLGDFINDYMVDKKYKSDYALMCSVDFKIRQIKFIKVKRRFINSSSIPFIVSEDIVDYF